MNEQDNNNNNNNNNNNIEMNVDDEEQQQLQFLAGNELEKNPLNTLFTLLTVNRAYKEAIDDKLNQLSTHLAENLERQSELRFQLRTSQFSSSATATSGTGSASSNRIFANNKTISNFSSSSLPSTNKWETELNKIKDNYFFDRFHSEPSENVDTILKSKLIYYEYIPQMKPSWTIEYRKKLKQAIIKDGIRIIQTPFRNKISLLEEKLFRLAKSIENSVMEDEQHTLNEELSFNQRKLKELRLQIKKNTSFSETKILNQIDYEKIDWMKISKIDMNNEFSANDCKLVWCNAFGSRINQEKWTLDENARLIQLAREYNEKSWDKINIALNTNRTAFLCMKRYHEKTADKYCKRDWTDDETAELCVWAEQHRVGIYIPFNYLCYLNGTRDRNSVYLWFLKINPWLNHGKWTIEEEQSFKEAIQFYSLDRNNQRPLQFNWLEISEMFVVTRTALQCKEKYELRYVNPQKYVNWSRDEDRRLLDAHDLYSGQWFRIAAMPEFAHRTDHSILFRYNKLQTWKRQNQWLQNQPADIREFLEFLFNIGGCGSLSRRTPNLDNRESDEPLFTAKGEQVPQQPRFQMQTHALSNIMRRVHEHLALVRQFLEKKHQNELSLSLLSQIGIFTPGLNQLINNYKRLEKQQQRKQEKINKKNKSILTKQERLELIQEKLKLKQSQKLQKQSEKKKKREKKISKTIEKRKDFLQTKSKKKRRKKINDYIEQQTIISPTIPEITTTTIKAKSHVVSKKQAKVKIKKKPMPRIKDILKKIELEQEDNSIDFNIISSLNLNETNQQFQVIGQYPTLSSISTTINTTTATIPIIRKNSTTAVSRKRKQPLPKKTRKEKISKKKQSSVTPVTAASDITDASSTLNNSESEQNNSITIPTAAAVNEEQINEISSSGTEPLIESLSISSSEILKPTSLLVEFDQIEIGKKIPCLIEEINLFKYMYSLKRDAEDSEANKKYFDRFKFIRFRENFIIGIRTTTTNQMSDEYLTEKRVRLIELALKKVLPSFQ